jgi:hypothetical protein
MYLYIIILLILAILVTLYSGSEKFEIEPNTIMGGYTDHQSEWQI